MENRITAQEVLAAFESGVIRLINAAGSPYYGDGVACEIGGNFFYFGGEEAMSMTAEEYLRDIPMETIVDEVVSVLDEFQNGDEIDHDEWLLYRYLIDENKED